ncbi:PP2C domain containing protein [Trichuris trichiura]|uniref:PP2C domain containing protein n=1 Tax=Trichuris trichiura TaxID=36087 RepID=A0A077Z6F0_TRITR|nr:PP2C domain containing protein [Trichuris trichiura]
MLLRRRISRLFVYCFRSISAFVQSYHCNCLPANRPCEDQHAEGYCRLDNSYFFGVFDGHGGPECAKAVASRLYDYLALSILPEHVLKEIVCLGTDFSLVDRLETESSSLVPDKLKSQHINNIRSFASNSIQKNAALSYRCSNVRDAFKRAFLALDEDLIKEALPDRSGHIDADSLRTVMSGSCACVAYVKGRNLYIAQLGDSAAILGVNDDSNGVVWTARKLTHEHTVDDDNEVKRIRAEHPFSEEYTVFRRGRLLGELVPLRAFGDVRYKWTAQQQNAIISTLLGARPTPANYFTPPYLTSEPSVYYYRLTENDKFLVLASDGFWDMVFPEMAVRLVSNHMIGVETLIPYEIPAFATFRTVLEDLRVRKERAKKRPADANCATHLIRYALTSEFAEANPYTGLSYVLGIPTGLARAYRDDMTVFVIYFPSV